jgi:ABC-2 type transport system ATP-binding protein
VIRFEGVSKSYGPVQAVRDLDLTVESGEVFGFLGPNGAGKTTTIKIAVGLLAPDRGRVQIENVDVGTDPLRAKSLIGYIPDNPDVYERLTGLEYLNFMADVFEVPAAVRQRRGQELLEAFELEHAVRDLIDGYSHGMRQKIVLIGALIHQPPVLILDEPMVGLDPRSSRLLKDILEDHCRQGGTVFFSTHVLEVAERLCHRIGIIHKGQLIALGTMQELREQARRGHVTGQEENLEDIFLRLTADEAELVR